MTNNQTPVIDSFLLWGKDKVGVCQEQQRLRFECNFAQSVPNGQRRRLVEVIGVETRFQLNGKVFTADCHTNGSPRKSKTA